MEYSAALKMSVNDVCVLICKYVNQGKLLRNKKSKRKMITYKLYLKTPNDLW